MIDFPHLSLYSFHRPDQPRSNSPTGRVFPVAVYEVRNLTKIYRQGAAPANDDLSFDIEQGEIFGLLGPNGAGKTTLVRQLVGLVKPTRGSIRLFGHDIVRSAAAVPRCVAYLAQRPLAVAEVYVSDAIALTGRIRGLGRREAAARARELMGLFGLEPVARRPIMRLSGGQQRLVTLALALIGDLPVLILDEPTNELDPEHRRLVWDLLLERNRRHGTTVVLVTHNVLEAERVIQRVGIINHGRIMALGRVGELKARVDQRVRLELRFSAERGEVPPAARVGETAGGQVLELARGHYAVLVDRAELQAAVARVLDAFGPGRLEDFRIQTPTLEDVYLQLGGGTGLAQQRSA